MDYAEALATMNSIKWYVPRQLNGAAHVVDATGSKLFMFVLMVGRRGVGEFFAGFGVAKMQAPTSDKFKDDYSFCESWVYLETPYSTEAEAIREGYVKALGMWSN